jgi:hypothetical protein
VYEKNYYLETPVSNNQFSFDLRRQALGVTPKLFIPRLVDGTIEDLREGTEIVFEDFDGGQLKRCRGLERFVKMASPFSDAPVYVADNHNHAFAFWADEKLKGTLRAPAVIVHVDQHRDTRRPERMPAASDLSSGDSIYRYVNTELNVGNFIPPALESGIADALIHIGSEEGMDSFSMDAIRRKPVILDLDLDFFAPELDYIPNEKKIRFIRELLPAAALVTAATSPFFIDQDTALAWLRRLLDAKNA